tara:strand:- start:13 stop:294 length:282 start_codon:yes stop_codon:yes gene_type:complete
MVSEAQESSYRKRFPKGKDWKEPKPNPYRDGGSGLHPDSYHGMETVAVSIEKYNELMRNFNRTVTTLNNILQSDPANEYVRKTLEAVDIIPKK